MQEKVHTNGWQLQTLPPVSPSTLPRIVQDEMDGYVRQDRVHPVGIEQQRVEGRELPGLLPKSLLRCSR